MVLAAGLALAGCSSGPQAPRTGEVAAAGQGWTIEDGAGFSRSNGHGYWSVTCTRPGGTDRDGDPYREVTIPPNPPETAYAPGAPCPSGRIVSASADADTPPVPAWEWVALIGGPLVVVGGALVLYARRLRSPRLSPFQPGGAGPPPEAPPRDRAPG